MEARLLILSSSLDLWRRNEFESGLRSLFQVSVGSAHKIKQSFNSQFIDYIEKHDFLQTTSNIGILYTVEKYFLP